MDKIYFFAALLAASFLGCAAGGRVDAPKRAEAEKRYVSAVAKYGAQDLTGAGSEAAEALRQDPSFYQAELLLGKVHFFEQRDTEALTVFQGLAAAHPEFTEARLWRVRCLLLAGNYAEAEKLLDDEASWNGADWRVHFQRAQLAMFQGDSEKRLSSLRSAEAYLEDAARVYLELAKLWYALGLEDRSKMYVEKALVLANPGSAAKVSLESLRRRLSAEAQHERN